MLEKIKENDRAYYQRNKEEIKARTAARWRRSRWASILHASRSKARKCGYTPITLTEAELIAWVESRPWRCEGCGAAECVGGRKLNIDHDHKTGKPRALVCNRCNIDLGALDRFEADPARAERLKRLHAT